MMWICHLNIQDKPFIFVRMINPPICRIRGLGALNHSFLLVVTCGALNHSFWLVVTCGLLIILFFCWRAKQIAYNNGIFDICSSVMHLKTAFQPRRAAWCQFLNIFYIKSLSFDQKYPKGFLKKHIYIAFPAIYSDWYVVWSWFFLTSSARLDTPSRYLERAH